MNIGEKLKTLRKHYGYSQLELAEKLQISQNNISYYESMSESTGLLDHIIKFCTLFHIPVAEFFMEDVEELKKDLPDYITPSDAAILKILNTSVDIKTRNEVKSAFVHIMKAILIRYEDRLKHMPEYYKIFGDTEVSIAAEPAAKFDAEKKD